MTLGGARAAGRIVAAPNPGWAEQVFGEPDVERLWEAVSVAMRLDAQPDVVEEWREHRDLLRARSRALDRPRPRRRALPRRGHRPDRRTDPGSRLDRAAA